RPPALPLFPYTTLFRSRCSRHSRSARSSFLIPQDAFFLSGLPKLVILQFFIRPDSHRRSTKGTVDRETLYSWLTSTRLLRGLARSEEHTSELQSPYDLV